MLPTQLRNLSPCDGRPYSSGHAFALQPSRFHDGPPALRLGAERCPLGPVVERPLRGQRRAACRARCPPVPRCAEVTPTQGRGRRECSPGQALRRALVCRPPLPAVAFARCGGAAGRCRCSITSGTHAGTTAAGPPSGGGRGGGDGADQGGAGAAAPSDAGQARGAGAGWSLVDTRPGSVNPAAGRECVPGQGYAESSSRTILAPSLSARSLPRATSRASGAMPQLVLG